MPTYNCTITETRGKTWFTPGTSTYSYTYTGGVNMDGFSYNMVDSQKAWSCKKAK